MSLGGAEAESGSQRTRGSSGGSLPLRRDPVQEEPLMPTLRASAFPGGSLVKNPSANARDAGQESSIPGSGRSLEEEMATYSSILV